MILQRWSTCCLDKSDDEGNFNWSEFCLFADTQMKRRQWFFGSNWRSSGSNSSSRSLVMAQPSSRLEKPTKRSPNCLRHSGLKSPEKLVSFCSMNSVCSMVASWCSRINISVRNDNFYSENAFGQRFQCLQLFIGFSQLFIDFPDIGPLLKIEKVK